MQNDKFIKANFSRFDWFQELLENVDIFKELINHDKYEVKNKLETRWISASPYNLQSDIFQVYQKALFHSVTVTGKNSAQMFIEASSFPKSTARVYPYKG